MNEGLILLMIALLLILVFSSAVHWRKRDMPQRVHNANQLADVVRSAEVANNGFFRALELVQKNLETLIARAENAEQRVRSLMLHPGIEKREQYTAAALLLAEGHDVERVSSMLGLPQAQVQLIRELQQLSGKEKRANRPKKCDESAVKDPVRHSRTTGSKERNTDRPILLVDVLKSAATDEHADAQSLSVLKNLTV